MFAPVGAEGEGVDGGVMVEGVEVLAVIEVPEHRLGRRAVILRTRTRTRTRKRAITRTRPTLASLPPEAQREPSGLMVTVFR